MNNVQNGHRALKRRRLVALKARMRDALKHVVRTDVWVERNAQEIAVLRERTK